jgi:thiamine phosphate synthase YjbQ (UPF0047 family)
MKTFRKELWLETKKRYDYVNITPQVQAAIAESGVREGLCLVNSMHITASVFINDDESGLHADFGRWLKELAPHVPGHATLPLRCNARARGGRIGRLRRRPDRGRS